jgi:hypothetical protein
MKTWDDWSDLEIDAQVTMVVYNLHDWEYSDNMQQFYHCGACGNETNNQPVINYCNSWADMGPIIAKSKIDLTYEGGFRMEWESSHIKHLNEYEVDVVGSNYHVNPLRAAAIVFLMMNGVNPG